MAWKDTKTNRAIAKALPAGLKRFIVKEQVKKKTKKALKAKKKSRK